MPTILDEFIHRPPHCLQIPRISDGSYFIPWCRLYRDRGPTFSYTIPIMIFGVSQLTRYSLHWFQLDWKEKSVSFLLSRRCRLLNNITRRYPLLFSSDYLKPVPSTLKYYVNTFSVLFCILSETKKTKLRVRFMKQNMTIIIKIKIFQK